MRAEQSDVNPVIVSLLMNEVAGSLESLILGKVSYI